MTTPKPKQFNRRLYSVVALVSAVLAGAQLDSILHPVLRDPSYLARHMLSG